MMKESDDKVQEADDDSWVFDSLVNFLHGPIWKLPVVSFLEDKSVVFDPDSYSNMTSEKEEEYRKIHEEYKGLVDYMLTNFMEDLQVTSEQVEDACRIREHTKQSQPESSVTKISLEQLWAAEDFNAFRRLMTRKNIDLQLQSLELLVAKYGVLSPSLRNSTDLTDGESNGEEDFLQVVISQIRNQEFAETFEDLNVYNQKTATAEASDAGLTSTGRSGVTCTQVELNRVACEAMAFDAPQQLQRLTSLKKGLEIPDGEEGSLTSNNPNIPTGSALEIQQRREYMRAQRDKLVALKKLEREKLLAREDSRSGPSRPKSARAAHLALTKVPNPGSNERSLAARRAIAERLKQELIDK